jgi:endonuclease G, mitochondrial
MTTTNIAEKLKNMASQITEGDEALKQELSGLQSSAAFREEAGKINSFLASSSTNESLEAFDDAFSQEAVILRLGRPVLSIVNSDTQTSVAFDNDLESAEWQQRIAAAGPLLHNAITAVGRIEIQNHPSLDWAGTGWLIDKDTVVTNRHVAEVFARNNGLGFEFKQNGGGKKMSSSIDLLEEFGRTEVRVLKLERILHIEPEPGPDIAFFKAVPVNTTLPQPVILKLPAITAPNDVAVIGYPAKDSRMPDAELMEKIFGNVFNKKRLAPGKITNVTATRLFHDCSTLGGCSGGAVIDLKTGHAVGLHFGGRFSEANFAVPIALVAQRLEQIKKQKKTGSASGGSGPVKKETLSAETEPVATPVQAGAQTVTIPLHITISLGGAISAVTAASPVLPPAVVAAADEPDEFFTEGRPEEYDGRKGYDAAFLGDGVTVPLPVVTGEKRKKDILTYKNKNKTDQVLRYQHFSVVMSKSRRQCIYSAVNINGAKTKKAARVAWRTDPRIPAGAQILKECYGAAPKYSRGHMTRREDPIWGTDADAQQGNADSMCVTNTVPQMQSFNAPVWLALENYALSHAREDKMHICVFTGPVFKSNDVVQYGIKIPKEFWKVIAFVHDETGELTATGYMMSQEEHIPDIEFVFGEFGTAQVSIASIEKLTGLSFGELSSHDPMNDEAAGDPVRPLTERMEIRF